MIEEQNDQTPAPHLPMTHAPFPNAPFPNAGPGKQIPFRKVNDFGWISVICDCCRGTVTVRAQGITFWYVGKDTPPTTSWPGGPQAVRPYPETAPPAPPTGPQGTDVDGPVGPGYRPPGSRGGYIPMGS